MSERIGRYPVCNIALVGFVAFNLGCALSPNIGALLAFRFLVGVFGASPMTTSGGIIFDLWDTKVRLWCAILPSMYREKGETRTRLFSYNDCLSYLVSHC